MRDHHYTVSFGRRSAWGKMVPLVASTRDLMQHTFIVGKTGTGKSTLIESLLLQHIAAGSGVGLLDPHGDLARHLLEMLPPSVADRLVYFNPADQDWPIGFNVLHDVPASRRHLIVSGVIAAMRSIWHDSWGPRMEYILANTLAALVECQNVTLLAAQRMLTDAHFRRRVLRQVHDPVVQAFWTNEYERYDDRFRREAIAPIQNKIGQFLMVEPLRNVLGQIKRKVDLRFMMDTGRIFIANLSKGELGEDAASLMGSLLVTEFHLAALSRTNVLVHNRRPFFLFIDEFSSFGTNRFSPIMAESRKFGLSLTLAAQHLSGTAPAIRDAILGNVGSIVAFRVGDQDAEYLARELGGGFSRSAFTSLGNYSFATKLLVEGEHGDPVLGATDLPDFPRFGRHDAIVRHCRQKYATPRSIVEDRLRRWFGQVN